MAGRNASQRHIEAGRAPQSSRLSVLARDRVVGNGEIGRRAAWPAGRAIVGEIDRWDSGRRNERRPAHWEWASAATLASPVRGVNHAHIARWFAQPSSATLPGHSHIARSSIVTNRAHVLLWTDSSAAYLDAIKAAGLADRVAIDTLPRKEKPSADQLARDRGADGGRRSGGPAAVPCPSCAGPRR